MRISSLILLLVLIPGVVLADYKTELVDAYEAQVDGDYATAWKIYNRMLTDPNSTPAVATVAYNMASMLERGVGVAKDETKALELYRFAADRGVDAAQNALGLYEQKKGNFREALNWYFRACTYGNAIYYNNAGNLLMGAVPELTDKPWGWAMLSLAADARNRVAKKNLTIYEPKMTPLELERGKLIKKLMMKCVAEGVTR